MTPIPPLEGRVRGVSADRYPLNRICAQPQCTEETADPHHCFARSQISNDSWFVAFVESATSLSEPIPHVTGLCRAHHDAVEDHDAWIKLEDDSFVWYDRGEIPGMGDTVSGWHRIGLLNPQPGSREGKPKRSPYKGEERRQRATITLRVPKDADEDGAGILDDLHEQVEERLGYSKKRPLYYTTVDAFVYVLQTYESDG